MRTRYRGAALAAALTGVVAGFAALAGSAAATATVTICHATGSGKYVTITVAQSGSLNGHSHHSGDIIDPAGGVCPGGGAGGGGDTGGGGGSGGGSTPSPPSHPAKPGPGTWPLLEMYKVEQHLTIREDEGTAERIVSCPDGDIAADGMWRADQVSYNAQLDADGPYDLHNGIAVTAAENTGPSSYRFRVVNRTENDVQLKLFVTCVSKRARTGSHAHDLLTSGPKTVTPSLGAGDQGFVAPQCATGEIAIAPGWTTTSGDAELFSSLPSGDRRGWTFGLRAGDAGAGVTASVRCLALKSGVTDGHAHRLQVRTVSSAERFDKGGGVTETVVSCGDHEKGLVAGFDVAGDDGYDPAALAWLGMDPRIKARAFKTLGAGHAPEVAVVCVGDRLAKSRS
jgi:hypothetical protein